MSAPTSPDRQSPPRTFYTPEEVAESMSMTYRQVIHLTKKGEIPFRYFGRLIRIPAWWLHEHLKQAAA